LKNFLQWCHTELTFLTERGYIVLGPALRDPDSDYCIIQSLSKICCANIL